MSPLKKTDMLQFRYKWNIDICVNRVSRTEKGREEKKEERRVYEGWWRMGVTLWTVEVLALRDGFRFLILLLSTAAAIDNDSYDDNNHNKCDYGHNDIDHGVTIIFIRVSPSLGGLGGLAGLWWLRWLRGLGRLSGFWWLTRLHWLSRLSRFLCCCRRPKGTDRTSVPAVKSHHSWEYPTGIEWKEGDE